MRSETNLFPAFSTLSRCLGDDALTGDELLTFERAQFHYTQWRGVGRYSIGRR